VSLSATRSAIRRAPWGALPREARDTLFLLAVIAWTVLPHVGHLPLWCSLLTAAVLAWRARLAMTQAALPNRWWLIAVLALAAAATFWSFRSLLGQEPGVTLAVVLMALKTLELRARRDAFVVFFLGFFLVLTHFLYSQSLLVALAMLGSVWGLLTALVLAHMPVGQPALRQAAGLAGRTALWGAPIMALLFVLFPRVGPLWGVPQDGLGVTGLSNSMRMGSVAELAQDDSIAMRLRFLTPGGVPPPAESLYFRGPVLGRFDGREWRVIGPGAPSGFPSALRPSADFQTSGPALRYELTLEPLKLTVLPLLEATATTPQIDGLSVRQRDDLQWIAERPVFERLRFSAEAHLQFRHGPDEPIVGLQDYVDLPPGYNPRTLAWAAALRREPAYAEADARTLAQAVFDHIRRAGYTYTLAPGTYGEANPQGAIDEFWLDRREGFCEHFAAAFVVVMRALDVPARVVTGYQGIDPLPVDGFHLVRQSAAHAWAEYWMPGQGWLRADPTAAVAPERIRDSRNLRPPPGLVAGALGNVSPALLANLRSAWESLDNRWNQWVLNYSRGQQMDLLKRLGVQTPSWESLAWLLTTLLSGLALAGAAWAWWDRARIDPWKRQRDSLGRGLALLGIPLAGHDAPRALAGRIRARLGEPGENLARMMDRLDADRYGRDARRRPDPEFTRRFAAEARALARTHTAPT
jgi:transglutaminase-like putative cysteine protease